MSKINTTELKNSFVKEIKFRKGVIKAGEAFKETKPFKGTRFERLVKLESFHKALCEIYGVVGVPVRITLKGIQKGWHLTEYEDALVIAATPKPALWSYLYAFSELVFEDSAPRNRVRWSLKPYRQ